MAELKSQRSRLHRLVDGEARAAKQAVPPPWKPSWVAGGKVQRRGGAETHRSSAALDQVHAPQPTYSDAKVANRDVSLGLARRDRKWSLNDGRIPNPSARL